MDLTPPLLARLHRRGPDRRGEGVHRRCPRGAVQEIAEAVPGLDVIVGLRRAYVELAWPVRLPGWIAGIPNALPRACAGLQGGRESW